MSEQRHSYSALSTFRSCPLKYRYRYIDGLELRDAARNTHHLVYGAAIHRGLETLYGAHQNFGEYNEGGLFLAQAEFKQDYPTQLDPSDRAKTQDNGIRALALYVNRWREEDRKWKVLEVEGPGALNYTLDSGLNELHCDLVLENLEHGGIYVMDHKTTTKALGPWYWDQYSPNSQITGYIDYVQQKYGACDGFIINAISLQWRDALKSDGKTNNVAWFQMENGDKPWLAYSHFEPREYRGGVLGKKGTYMAAWGLQVGFERQTFQRSDEQVRQERESTRYWINAIERAEAEQEYADRITEKNGHIPISAYGFNTSSCYSCEYRGGEVIGGICRPGYTWPQDSELILLSYRQVCREVIQVACPECKGKRALPISAEDLAASLEILPAQEPANGYFLLPVYLVACSRCRATGLVDGPRCQLDRNHPSLHSPDPPAPEQEEIVVEVEV